MIERADAVVIGSGALGASAAYHLTKQGIGRVALLDKHGLASQNSRRAAGLTAQVRGTDIMTRLAVRAVEAVSNFTEDIGEPLVFHRTGSMKIARRQRDVEQITREVERGKRLGVGIERIEPEDARSLIPYLQPDGIQAISYTASDIYLEPSQLPLGFARAAEKRGATLLTETMVTGIELAGGRVAGVRTNKGPIATPIVVDAAGAWSRFVAAMSGAKLPAMATRHQLIVTEPVAGVEPTQPIVRVIDANIYFRPEGNGLLIGGYEPDSVQYDMSALPADFQVSDVPLDLDPLTALTEAVIDQFPVFREIAVHEHRVGLPTMTPDGRQMAGPMPGVEGLWVASGCCVGGLSISPAVGEGLAEWIVTGQAPFELDFLSPERFRDVEFSEEQLRRECDWQYGHRYISH
jgi:4-methylaminobutanoate oxidase (formaldehyde-forming)